MSRIQAAEISFFLCCQDKCLSWLFLLWKCSGFTPSSSSVSELPTLSLREDQPPKRLITDAYYPRPCPFGHDQQFMTKVESWNVDRLFLYFCLFNSHNSLNRSKSTSGLLTGKHNSCKSYIRFSIYTKFEDTDN